MLLERRICSPRNNFTHHGSTCTLQIGVFKADKSSVTKYSARQQYADNIGTMWKRKLPNLPWKMILYFHQMMFALSCSIIVLHKYEVTNVLWNMSLRFSQTMLSIMTIIVPYKCEIIDIIGNKSLYFDRTGFVLSNSMVRWNYIREIP